MILNDNTFRDLLRESYDLSWLTQEPKYNLHNKENLRLYELWAPFVMKTKHAIESKNYMLLMMEVMSMLLIIKDENNNRNRFRVRASEIDEMYRSISPEDYDRPSENTQQIRFPAESHIYNNDNVIDFSQYKRR